MQIYAILREVFKKICMLKLMGTFWLFLNISVNISLICIITFLSNCGILKLSFELLLEFIQQNSMCYGAVHLVTTKCVQWQCCTATAAKSRSWLKYRFLVFLWFCEHPNYFIYILLYYTCLDPLNQPKRKLQASQKPTNHTILLKLPAMAYWAQILKRVWLHPKAQNPHQVLVLR